MDLVLRDMFDDHPFSMNYYCPSRGENNMRNAMRRWNAALADLAVLPSHLDGGQQIQPGSKHDHSHPLFPFYDDQENFVAHLDLRGFEPQDIKLKTKDNTISMVAHNEKEHSVHHVERSWTLPASVDVAGLESKLDKHGRLHLKAPRKEQDKKAIQGQDRPIPIERN